MKLYYSKNSNPRLAVAVARYLNSPVEFVAASPQHPADKEAFKALNPNALVPVLEENGKTLWEADAIACRLSALAKSDLLTAWTVESAAACDIVLGVGIAGAHAGDLISEGVLALEMAAVAEDIASSIHPHPATSETLAEAAEAMFGKSIHGPH